MPDNSLDVRAGSCLFGGVRCGKVSTPVVTICAKGVILVPVDIFGGDSVFVKLVDIFGGGL